MVESVSLLDCQIQSTICPTPLLSNQITIKQTQAIMFKIHELSWWVEYYSKGANMR